MFVMLRTTGRTQSPGCIGEQQPQAATSPPLHETRCNLCNLTTVFSFSQRRCNPHPQPPPPENWGRGKIGSRCEGKALPAGRDASDETGADTRPRLHGRAAAVGCDQPAPTLDVSRGNANTFLRHLAHATGSHPVHSVRRAARCAASVPRPTKMGSGRNP